MAQPTAPKSTLGGVTPPALIVDVRPIQEVEAEVLAVPVWPGDEETGPLVGRGGAELCEALDVDLLAHLDRAGARGTVGEIVAVPLVPARTVVQQVLLVGLGDGSNIAYRRAGAALARRVKGESRVATTMVAGAGDELVRAFVEGLVLASYAFLRKSRVPEKGPVATILLADMVAAQQPALDRAIVTSRAGWLARDLVQAPSNEKDPSWLARQAERVAGQTGLRIRVWNEQELCAEGFGGIVAVGMGSARPPRLVQLTYEPAEPAAPMEPVESGPHIVLVGKGITFDTGGLSIKPRESMVPMKTDMSGGAVVIAVLAALREVGCRVRVTGLVAAAENMPSGSAQRPGDVIRQYDGTTVEVANTDAEGRLVLADAMAYAVAELSADILVDVATLTGAATLGLGKRHAALYATDDALADALIEAGDAAGERLWRMPLVDDYRFALDSEVADICHIATEKVHGGSITAALFLERFAHGVPWAHLDIAGPGRADADEHEVTKGGTGFGTRTLLRWLEGFPPQR